MERLVEKVGHGYPVYVGCMECLQKKEVKNCVSCPVRIKATKKLKKYEELEEKVAEVYGEADSLFEAIAKTMLSRELRPFDSCQKAVLLTDEDVDRWHEYRDAAADGRMMIIPKLENGVIWAIGTHNDKQEVKALLRTKGWVADHLKDFGKLYFATKKEAEVAMAESNV